MDAPEKKDQMMASHTACRYPLCAPHRLPLWAFIQRFAQECECVCPHSYVSFATLSYPVFIDSSVSTAGAPAHVAVRVNEAVVASQKKKPPSCALAQDP